MGARRYVNISKPRARSSVGSERLATNQKVGSSSPPGRATFSFFFIYLQASIFSAHSSREALSRKCNASRPWVGLVVGSLHVLSHLVNQPQLINAFRLRATMTHGALHNCIGSNPTQSRAEHMA